MGLTHQEVFGLAEPHDGFFKLSRGIFLYNLVTVLCLR